MSVGYLQEMAMSKPTSKDSKGCKCGNEMQWNKLTMSCYHENVKELRIETMHINNYQRLALSMKISKKDLTLY